MADTPTNPPANQPNAMPTPGTPPAPKPGAAVPMTVPTPRKKRGRFSAFLGYVLFARGKEDEIVIISHSSLFYWWPVWFFGYVMAAITAFFPYPPTRGVFMHLDEHQE